MVFILIEYYFSLIGYTTLYEHYSGGRRCESLLSCFLTTVDYTFKVCWGGEFKGIGIGSNTILWAELLHNSMI